MKLRKYLLAAITVLPSVAASCGSAGEKSAFEEIYEKLTYPSSEWSKDDFGVLATKEERELLADHAPQFWLSKDACAPMDYYQQFVPNLRFVNASKNVQVSRAVIKATERDFSGAFEFSNPPDCIESMNPPLYSYSWQENMLLSNGNNVPVTILKYAFSFYKSGLPAEQALVQKIGVVLGDQDHWHFLDIHGAAFYLLDEEGKIITVVLAQHNHFRSYIVGGDIDLESAKNICFSIRSNEPYFCKDEQQVLPTAPTFSDMRWVITAKDRPLMGAWDVIPSKKDRRNIDYRLEFLSSRDPLITSWRELGPNIKVWGLFPTFFRNSPPGMAVYNVPDLKPIWKTAQYFYFDPSNSNVFDLHEKHAKDFISMNPAEVFKHNSRFYTKNLELVWPIR